MKTRSVEGVCPAHARRHRLVAGVISGQKVAQCRGEGWEWDVVHLSAKNTIVDMESGRETRELLEIEP